MAVLDHDHHHFHERSREEIRNQRICCVQFGLFWLGFFALVVLASDLFSFISP